MWLYAINLLKDKSTYIFLNFDQTKREGSSSTLAPLTSPLYPKIVGKDRKQFLARPIV